jgi:hypothetical protein
MSEPGFLRFELPEHQIRAMARGDRDFVLQATGEGRVSAVCKACVQALEILEDRGLVWFHCSKCDRVSFYPVGNVQRDIEFARRDGRPFVSDLFYLRQLPSTLASPFAAGRDSDG